MDPSTVTTVFHELEQGDQAEARAVLAGAAVVWSVSGAALVLDAQPLLPLGCVTEGAGLLAGLVAAYLWLGNPSDARRSRLTVSSGLIGALLLALHLLLAGDRVEALPVCLAAIALLASISRLPLVPIGFGLCVAAGAGSALFDGGANLPLVSGLVVAAGLAWASRAARRGADSVRQRSLHDREDALEAELEAARAELDRLNNPSLTLETRGEVDGMWEWNLKTDRVYVSPRWRSLLGYPDREVQMLSEAWLNLIHPYDLDEFLRRVGAHLDDKAAMFECEHRIRGADGSYRWVLSSGKVIRDSEGRPERITGTQVDIKRIKSVEADLVRQATHDRLTQLPNRERLLEELTAAVQSHNGTLEHSFTVAFIDLDGFKAVNDRLGHAAGDQLLIETARRIQEVCKEENAMVARLGGDEFVVLVRSLRRHRAPYLGQAIERAVGAPLMVQGEDVSTTASIGMTVAEDDQALPETLLQQADLAMYQAKADGKGCVRMYEPWMGRKANTAKDLARGLRQAIENNHFELYYQPIVSLQTGRIECVEALIRWRTPDGRFVSPGEFIPFAEKSDLIVEIGDWVVEDACRQIEQWRDIGLRPIKVSVNMSVKQLAQQGFADRLSERLQRRGVSPAAIQLEITETGLLSELSTTVESLDRLMLLGIATAVDDFGTGYSSLTYLRKLNCNVVKMDRSFVQDLVENHRDEALSRSIIALSHNLGLQVVAEGVETSGQLDILRAQGCNYVQGFLIARPMPARKIATMLGEDWNLFQQPWTEPSDVPLDPESRSSNRAEQPSA